MSRKPVVPAAVADALTAPKPPAASARAVSVLASDELAEKTIDELTAEILALQIQGNKVLFAIGKRLIAAKEKLSHGDWLPWLESVNIPERLAQRYMQLAREWAANPSILSDLGMSKALALLALPEDTRAEFVAEGHVVNGEEKSVVDMSNAELKAAIRARQAAESELDTVKCRLAESERLRSEAEQDAEKQHGELVRTCQRLELAQKETVDVRELLKSEQAARFAVADELAALKAKPVDVAIEKVADPEAIEAAKQAERASMQFLVDKANTERDVEHANANRIRDDMGRVKAELVKAEKALDDANKAAQEAAKDAQSARQELERVKAEKTPIADKDLSLFSVLFEQTQAAINKMHGIVLKLPTDKQESTRKVLSALADNIRKAAES
ncbi:MAG: DUF3102 domain-containing protein [Oscillibacter sp.]|nr:DUF3102 domain-containing protein [Oscillibacter sp.]